MSQSDFSELSSAEKLRFLDGILSADAFWDHQGELVTLAQDSNPEVRERALAAFWELADPRFIDLLTGLARTDPVLQVRCAAITALGRFIYEGFVMEELDEADYNEVKECLMGLYQNQAEPLDIRRTSLEALGFITNEEIEDLIREAYCDPNLKMRISALFAMGRSGTRTWDDILLEGMENPDPQIRFEAVRAAGETFMQSGAETLELLTSDPDREIRLAAIQALGKAGRPHSKKLLKRLANSPDEDIRDTAAEALEDMEFFEGDFMSEDSSEFQHDERE